MCLKLFLYCVISCLWRGSEGFDSYPHTLYHDAWNEERFAYRIYVHMTEYIAKDATLKLRHAERIAVHYQHRLSYHLGSIMAGIQSTFKHMLEVYRKYSNMSDYRSEKYYVHDVFNAYHIIKGDFNEIRMEKALFHKELEDYKRRNTIVKQKDRLEEARKKHFAKYTYRRRASKVDGNDGRRALMVDGDDGRRALTVENKDDRPASMVDGDDGRRALMFDGDDGRRTLTVDKDDRRASMFDDNDDRSPMVDGHHRRRASVTATNQELEEQYKSDLRQRKWEEKWQNFVPQVEGIDINIPGLEPDTGRLRNTLSKKPFTENRRFVMEKVKKRLELSNERLENWQKKFGHHFEQRE